MSQSLRSIIINPIVALGLLAGTNSVALAQAFDTEPNNTCFDSQDVGAVSPPLVVEGSLDTPPDSPDVDFYRFTAAPDLALVADLEGQSTGRGTIVDPYMGLFDSNCNVININDDFNSLNSHLEFAVPADGVFILAATGCCDNDFNGDGGHSGTYQLTLQLAPPSIESISGRVTNVTTGQPLRGDTEPYAFVELARCNDNNECFEVRGARNTDSEGRFFFDRGFSNEPLPIGTYQIRAFANDHQSGISDPFPVLENESIDIGDIGLVPPPISFSDVVPCNVLTQGSPCQYSVNITNNTPAPLRGRVWSIVDGYGLGSTLDYTVFEAFAATEDLVKARRRRDNMFPGRQRVKLESGETTTAYFEFHVPSIVRDGATICARMIFGLLPRAVFNTSRERSLFCITKGNGNFRLLRNLESRKITQSWDRKRALRRPR